VKSESIATTKVLSFICAGHLSSGTGLRNQLCWELRPGHSYFGSGAAPELGHGLGCAVGISDLASLDLTWPDGLLIWISPFLRFTEALLAGPGQCKGPCLLGTSGVLFAWHCTTMRSPHPHYPVEQPCLLLPDTSLLSWPLKLGTSSSSYC